MYWAESESEAEQILQDAKLKVTHGEAQYSDTWQQAMSSLQIRSREPKWMKAQGVQIVMSLGKEKVKVPDP